MSKILDFNGKVKAAENPHFSYVEADFSAGYEDAVRQLTKDSDAVKEAKNLAADRLIYAFITVNRTTGVSSEFGWASGRRDVHIIVDLPYENCASQVIEDRAKLIAKLQEKYYDRGFTHREYDGGFEKFAQNFERATGRFCPPKITVLCEGEQRLRA